jgi:hypothetical protein
MRIEIDTKEDLHNIKHIMRLLHAISANAGLNKSNELFNDYSDPYSNTSSPSSSAPAESTPGLFNMFDTPSTPSSTPSTDPFGMFDKKEEPKDNSDSIQLY